METQSSPVQNTDKDMPSFDSVDKFQNGQTIQKYIDEKKEIYKTLLTFLENTEDTDKNFQDLIEHVNSQQEKENYFHFFHLITNIANNHHRDSTFFEKIFQILNHYQNQIKQTFSNFDIYNIFQSNKLILLYFFENKIITVDEKLYFELIDKTEKNGNFYCHFFYPEIKEFLNDEQNQEIESELISKDPTIFNNFNEKRKIGENDSYICSLIRQDSVEDFISYVNKENISPTSSIKPSLFETNSILNEKDPTLIEYSAFYGSIQIFQYLMSNEVKLTSSLWIYVIHSRNAELIQLLENHKVQPPNNIYEKCFIESIKCHHNDVADYIKENLIFKDYNYEFKPKKEILVNVLQYHNYKYFPSDFKSDYELFYLSRFNYQTLVNLFIKKKEKEIKTKIKSENKNKNRDLLKKAASENKIEIIYYLLSKQTEIDFFSFYKIEELYTIAIPPSITSIEANAFCGCTSLTEISIPSSLKKIEKEAFKGCTSLTQISIPFSVTSIGDNVFDGCASLKQISIPSSLQIIGDCAFSECSELFQIKIPSSVKSIGSSAFYNCESLTQISIPSSVTQIRDKSFMGCTSLNQISIPSSVKKIGNKSFMGCTSLTQITLPSSVKLIGNKSFYLCTSLKQIVVPSSVISIGVCAFSNCTSLEKVSISSSSSVTSLDACLFYGCKSLIKVEIPSSVTKIGIMTFFDCSSLTDISIPSSITEIGSFAFYGCCSLYEKGFEPAKFDSFANVDDYEIKEIIEKDDKVCVYRVIDKKTDKEYALSHYNDSCFNDYQSFIEEIAISSIPNLIKIKSFRFPLTCEEQRKSKNPKISGFVTISDYYKNGNINLKNKKLNPTILSKIIYGVASIMKNLHKMNVVHRDLKHEKVFLNDNFEPIINNFNFSKFVLDEKDSEIIGTPLYMAPETFTGDYGYTIDFPSDVYSYAIFIYLLFSDEFIFEGKKIRNNIFVMDRISKGWRPKRPKNMPDHYWKLVQRCWYSSPDDRPSFNEITNLLKDDIFAIEDSGVKTDLKQLHEYQKRIDNDL